MSGTSAFVPLTSCCAGRADSLLGAVQDAEDTQDNVMLDGTEVNFPAEDIYQVQDASGRVLGHSPNWNGPDTACRQAKPANFSESMSTASITGRSESRACESSIQAIKAAASHGA